MAKREYDSHFCLDSALLVLEIQRKRLISDCCELHNSIIYNGLHEFESNNQRDLYFQLYLTEWIDAHWNEMNNLIDNNEEFRGDAKKQMIIFFATYFADFIEECSGSGKFAKTVVVPELLNEKIAVLNNLIEASEKWKENNEKLKADSKKHREKFMRLLKSVKKESGESG